MAAHIFVLSLLKNIEEAADTEIFPSSMMQHQWKKTFPRIDTILNIVIISVIFFFRLNHNKIYQSMSFSIIIIIIII